MPHHSFFVLPPFLPLCLALVLAPERKSTHTHTKTQGSNSMSTASSASSEYIRTTTNYISRKALIEGPQYVEMRGRVRLLLHHSFLFPFFSPFLSNYFISFYLVVPPLVSLTNAPSFSPLHSSNTEHRGRRRYHPWRPRPYPRWPLLLLRCRLCAQSVLYHRPPAI